MLLYQINLPSAVTMCVNLAVIRPEMDSVSEALPMEVDLPVSCPPVLAVPPLDLSDVASLKICNRDPLNVSESLYAVEVDPLR